MHCKLSVANVVFPDEYIFIYMYVYIYIYIAADHTTLVFDKLRENFWFINPKRTSKLCIFRAGADPQLKEEFKKKNLCLYCV